MYIRPGCDELRKKRISLILCGLLLVPLRLVLYLSVWSFWWLILKIMRIPRNRPMKPWKFSIFKKLNSFMSRLGLFILGYYYLPVINLKIQDYDPDYPSEEELKLESKKDPNSQ